MVAYWRWVQLRVGHRNGSGSRARVERRCSSSIMLWLCSSWTWCAVEALPNPVSEFVVTRSQVQYMASYRYWSSVANLYWETLRIFTSTDLIFSKISTSGCSRQATSEPWVDGFSRSLRCFEFRLLVHRVSRWWSMTRSQAGHTLVDFTGQSRSFTFRTSSYSDPPWRQDMAETSGWQRRTSHGIILKLMHDSSGTYSHLTFYDHL